MPLKKRIIILGGGFVSSAVESVFVSENINYLLLNSKKLDLTRTENIPILKNLIKKNDYIFLVASKAPVKSFDMLMYNLKILHNVCMGINPDLISKITYLSSDAVYSDTKLRITEKSSTNPESLHGYMHLLRENYLIKIFKKKLCIARSTLVYGHTDPHNGYGPNKFVRELKKNNTINLFGKGEEKRDHIYINDLAQILSKLVVNNYFGTLNLATGKVLSFYDIAKTILSLTKKNLKKIVFLKRTSPMPHNGYRSFDISLLKKIFRTKKIESFKKNIKKDLLLYREL
jgi:UDP-glucose 4-epimerase